jgi:hypothetical protein
MDIYSKLYCKNGSVRKFDVPNMEKVTIDADVASNVPHVRATIALPGHVKPIDMSKLMKE